MTDPATLETEESVILYIDFLGVKDAIKNPPQAEGEGLLGLLNNIAKWRGPFKVPVGPIGPGNTRLELPAEVTTFSDNIVVSYPIKNVSGVKEAGIISLLVSHAKELAGVLSVRAIEYGLLIRGGITIGKIYHRNSVVFGSGMVDAYELESKAAIYPRVVASPLLSERSKAAMTILLEEAEDGLCHLSYFKDLEDYSVIAGGRWREDGQWLTETRNLIERRIVEFERKGLWDLYAKWVWFSKKLEAGIEQRKELDEAV